MRAAHREARAAWAKVIPPAFWQHRRAARREMLLALRTVVDAALERLEPDEPPVSEANPPA